VRDHDWHRTPDIFDAGLRLFGNGFYYAFKGNHARAQTQKEIDDSCQFWRKAYPGCTREREEACATLMVWAMERAEGFCKANPSAPPIAAVHAILQSARRHEQAHERMKATTAKPKQSMSDLLGRTGVLKKIETESCISRDRRIDLDREDSECYATGEERRDGMEGNRAILGADIR